jgi:hypothetical protein
MTTNITGNISFSEAFIFAAVSVSVMLHMYGILRALRDVRTARREGIRNGSYMLFRQNLRTERARLHLKAAVLLVLSQLLLVPQPDEWSRWDTFLCLVASGVWHLNICAILDWRERQRIIDDHRRRKWHALQGGVWDGIERRNH